MSQTLADRNPHDRDHHIRFLPENHVYEIDGDPSFVSSTTLIHQFFPAFNAKEVLRRMRLSKNWPSSPYFDKTDDEIIQQWEDKKNRAAELGTRLHSFIENYYNEIQVVDPSDDLLREIGRECVLFEAFARDHSELYTPHRTEWSVFDRETRVAGSIDMVFHRANDPPDTLCIFDWKRVASLKMKNPFQRGLSPIRHLDDCNFHHYSLQLNIYKYILESCYGKNVAEMKLVLIHPDNDNYRVIDVPDMTIEIKKLMDARLEQLMPSAKPSTGLRLLGKPSL